MKMPQKPNLTKLRYFDKTLTAGSNLNHNSKLNIKKGIWIGDLTSVLW